MITTILTFVIILGALILVHEFGHFIAAKIARAKVEEFGLGFPPRIFGVKRGETIYSINLLPIGGFVKVFGEDGEQNKSPKSFASKSIGIRAIILAAGVLMNLALAVSLFSVGHIVGLPRVVDEDAVEGNVKNIVIRIADIAKNSPAEQVQMQVGDIIYAIRFGEERIENVQKIGDIQKFTNRHLGQAISLTIKRNGELLEKIVTPRENPPRDEGAIGFAMVRIGEVSYPLYLAPLKGIESTVTSIWETVKAFGMIFSTWFSTGKLTEDIAGPIGIAVITGEVQKMGLIFLLQFVALISINLAIINVLPIPALDGGRLLFLLIEKIRGAPVKQKYEKLAHTVGFAVLILLMILVTIRDVGKFL